MKCYCKLIIPNISPVIAKSVEPDNLPNMRLNVSKDYIITEIEVDEIGTLISTIDDYIMNLRIAESLVEACKSKLK
ncbi:MAG: KEOPS complex subunit Pcc1 [Methanocellales archaeon]